jgi:hypothetical protein
MVTFTGLYRTQIIVDNDLDSPQSRRNPVIRCGPDDSAGERNMKKILVAAVIAVSFAPLGAHAQERVGDAALGALSGAVVLGPVGAVAGAVVGYTAGPAIARSWGLRPSEPRYQRRPAKRYPKAAAGRGAAPQAAPPQATVSAASAPATNRAVQSAGARNIAPPVQGLE